ncbi:MAG TPA: PDZ domain-containing protein, partial [Anaerovoracaceae bacterium]|nr:PDZ domain-containing protein [Anaerovoracaceae bacterium]
GVISGLNRSITVSNGQSAVTMDNLIQTDASINSGNSGGPLLNNEGNVIGINSAKAQSAEGLGFAIPINTAKPIIDSIKLNGEFHRAYIGIKGISVAEYQQISPDVKLGAEKGVYINQIFTESPAAKAGIKEGDIIIAIENKEIDTMTQLINDLYNYKSGDTIKLTIIRGENNIKETIDVKLGEMPN